MWRVRVFCQYRFLFPSKCPYTPVLTNPEKYMSARHGSGPDAKKNISPQNSPSAGGWFWYFGLGPILLCSRPGAIPFSVVFLCLTPAENAQMRSVRLFGEDFHQTDPGEFHPVRINQTSPWKSDTPQGDPGDLCLKFPRGTNSGSLISPADSEQIIHGVGVRFVFPHLSGEGC